MASPWADGMHVLDGKGEIISTEIEREGIISFETTPGQTYELKSRRSL